MPNRNHHLLEDATEFSRIAALEIHRTFSLVIESSKTLLITHGKHVLDESTLNEALRLADQAELPALFGLLRDKASRFGKELDTTAYWAWIDAAGFYFDATSVSWPYMTMNGRRSNLAFAQECVFELQSTIGSIQ